MKAILFDTETGGLEPATDALCSIGAVVFDTDAPTVDECILARAHWPICVPHDSPLRVTEEALRVQGLTRDDLADSGRLEEKYALHHFNGWGRDVDHGLTYRGLWAWNAAFDGAFMSRALDRAGMSRALDRAGIRFVFRSRCAQHFAWNLGDFYLLPTSPSGARLADWAAHYGLTQPEPHNAQADAEVAAKVLWHLVRALKRDAGTVPA